MKMAWTLIFLLVSCQQSSEPSRNFVSKKTQRSEDRNLTSPKVKVTNWLAVKEQRGSSSYGYLREDTHTFSNGLKGKVYTVLDLEFRDRGQMSADGQVVRYKKDRHGPDWEAENLGRYSLLEGAALLLNLPSSALKRITISPLKASELLGDKASKNLEP